MWFKRLSNFKNYNLNPINKHRENKAFNEQLLHDYNDLSKNFFSIENLFYPLKISLKITFKRP